MFLVIHRYSDQRSKFLAYDDGGQELGQVGDPAVAEMAGLELHRKIETMAAEKGGPYADAFRAVMADPKNAALKQCYVGLAADRYVMERAQPDADMTSLEAGAEIDTRAKAYRREHPGVTYQEAADFVLSIDPVLKMTYAKTSY